MENDNPDTGRSVGRWPTDQWWPVVRSGGIADEQAKGDEPENVLHRAVHIGRWAPRYTPTTMSLLPVFPAYTPAWNQTSTAEKFDIEFYIQTVLIHAPYLNAIIIFSDHTKNISDKMTGSDENI